MLAATALMAQVCDALIVNTDVYGNSRELEASLGLYIVELYEIKFPNDRTRLPVIHTGDGVYKTWSATISVFQILFKLSELST